VAQVELARTAVDRVVIVTIQDASTSRSVTGGWSVASPRRHSALTQPKRRA